MPEIDFSWRAPTFSVTNRPVAEHITETLSFLKKTHRIFDAVWMDDHFHPWLEGLSNDTPVLECWTSLTYLSAMFTDLYYSGIVFCNSYRNPALLAKSSATISCLTGGRFVLGIGAGWKEDEYIGYGYPFPSARVRIEQLEESVRIIRKMWTGKRVDFDGKYYKMKGAYCSPRPVKAPPIMIGGSGERFLLGVVARQADWWNLHGVSPATFVHKTKVLEEHCSKAGRDVREIRKTWGGNIAIAETDAEARQIAASSPFSVRGEKGGALVGSPATVKAQMQAFVDVGVTHFHLRFMDFPSVKGAQLFGRAVLPSFRKKRIGPGWPS